MTAEAQSVFGGLSIRSYENQEPVYAGRNSDGSSSHRLLQALPVGDYVWRMAYDWQGEGGMKGSTRWSTLGHFTAWIPYRILPRTRILPRIRSPYRSRFSRILSRGRAVRPAAAADAMPGLQE